MRNQSHRSVIVMSDGRIVTIRRRRRSDMGYVRSVVVMFMHRAHACEYTDASSRVVKQSLIFGLILSKFDENILQVTTHCMAYVLKFPRTACAWASTRVNHARMCMFSHLWKDSLQIWWGHTTYPQMLHGLFNVRVNVCPKSAHQYTFANRDTYDP
jgi:hypothetical protein